LLTSGQRDFQQKATKITKKNRAFPTPSSRMHFHLRYLRFLLFQIPFLIRETLTAVNLRRK